jgi:hypothetical protein
MRYELLLIVPIGLAACDSDHSLGNLGPETYTADAAVSSDARVVAVAPDARALEQLGPLESWTGYIENYHFASGSDAIKLTLANDPSGQLAGSVVFGSGTPPAPATDPNVGYPPGFSMSSIIAEPTEGFSFAITSGSLVSNRLRFAINGFQLWEGWCALQPAPTDGSDMCVPNWGGGSDGDACYQVDPAGTRVAVDCGKVSLCFMNRVCACSPAGCVANAGMEVTFDMFEVDGTASGSVAGNIGEHNVHFTKDP